MFIFSLLMVNYQQGIALSSEENIQGASAFLRIDRTLLEAVQTDRTRSMLDRLTARMQARLNLKIKDISTAGLVFFADPNLTPGIVVTGSRIDGDTIQSIFDSQLPGQCRKRQVGKLKLFSIPGIISGMADSGIILLMEGDQVSQISSLLSNAETSNNTMAEDSDFKTAMDLTGGVSPDFLLFTHRGGQVADWLEDKLAVSELVYAYRSIFVTLKEETLVLVVSVEKNTDVDQIVHNLTQKIAKDPWFQSKVDFDSSATKETALFLRLLCKKGVLDQELHKWLTQAMELFPDSNEELKKNAACRHQRDRLLHAIIAGAMKPSALNQRSTKSCPNGGTYLFREGKSGPEITCTKH
jgi:hypothetical protein